MWETVLGIIASLAAILLLWFRQAADRKKAEIYKQLETLEQQYRKAMCDKDPVLAAKISMEMSHLREKYTFLKEKK